MIFTYKVKSTEVLEQEKQQLWNDYQTYLKVENSDEIKQYLTLKEKVEAVSFLKNKKEIESLKFKGSPEYHLLKKFQKIEKNKKIVRYLDLKDSAELERFKNIEAGDMLKKINELKSYVKNNFKADAKAFKKEAKVKKDENLVWEETPAYKKKDEYENLIISPDYRFYTSFKKSSEYKNFTKVEGSNLLNQYEDMKAEIESEAFIERKAYLEDENRYEKTDDYKMLVSFNELDKNPDIQLYMKYNDIDAFQFFREWDLSFDENFSKLDSKRWAFVTPIAQKGPGKNFSIKGQLHYYNDADNFNTENNILTLETKKEQIEGIAWDQQFGFIPKTFQYVSGVMHTAGLFEQQYGYFEMKFKASKVKGVVSSVSLFDPAEELALRAFSSDGGKLSAGVITTDRDSKNYSKIKLKKVPKGYVIVSLEWSPEKIEWRVNDKHMGTMTENVPHIPMALRIETEVLKDTTDLPHRIDIDWIKCYKRK